ncbi:MAG TPA: UbiA family prenyltransferase, partial [Acidobacteriota bacterium]
MQVLKCFLISMRPRQWVKNVFVFAPMIFSLHLFQAAYIWRSLLAFVLFSLVTGTIYVFNDVLDREKDILHPVKKERPIASGRLGIRAALLLAAGLLAGVLLLIARFNREFFLIAAFYVGLNVLYSIVLKRVVIIDIMVIALG